MPAINLDEIPDQQKQETLKQGQYTLRVIESVKTDYEKDGEQRTRIDNKVEVVSPQVIQGPNGPITVAGVNWRESIYLTPKAMGMAKKTLGCFGITGTIDPDLLPSMLHGKSARAYVRVTAQKLVDENTGVPVKDETGQDIIRARYQVGEWLGRAADSFSEV